MKKLGIIIDSFSGVSQSFAHELGYHFLPLQVELDNVKYEDGVVESQTILEKLTNAESFLTSLPRLELIEKAVEAASKEFQDVLVLTINENLSSTSRYIQTIAHDFPNVKVVNNHFTGIQIIKVAKYAQKLYQQGLALDQIIEKINKINEQSLTILVPTNLKYILKGGRLNTLKKLVLNTIMMIPILSYNLDGTVGMINLKRTLKGAINKAIDRVEEFIAEIGLQNYECNWMHGVDSKVNQMVVALCNERGINLANEQLTSSAIAIHTGPEAFAITVMPKIED
ncbi:DegV family protein [Mycoplasmopsis gallopavonis]|uniref:Fatty acid-binding protein DegV-like protein n=1 Tax=Mycoplasmopsis gallopavonis TaxID=76629 RepID=A0A449B080_9BACT|nr:DegV family protein [Mycoplasmopsis gallopavonis]RIV16842.1 DegV family EDD domain-containing protein [Mycoplasmopsis gallopavonis]VEU73146.1 fatty acid-binding protein DegV-like protein [Mycoplasmopsis gallopavonis]